MLDLNIDTQTYLIQTCSTGITIQQKPNYDSQKSWNFLRIGKDTVIFLSTVTTVTYVKKVYLCEKKW